MDERRTKEGGHNFVTIQHAETIDNFLKPK